MSRHILERCQISLFGGLLRLTWWCRQASLAVERRLLRAGVWLTDSQRPGSHSGT